MNLLEMLDAVKWLHTGDYCECGVWQGYTAKTIAEYMNGNSILWLLDSFEGHGEPGPHDKADEHPKGRYADTDKDSIHRLIPRGVIVPGFIPNTLRALNGRLFRFVHIDLDHYLPTYEACLFFKGRMVPGGIIRFDDYDCSGCPGATRAVDEVFGKDAILPGDWRWVAPTRGDKNAE